MLSFKDLPYKALCHKQNNHTEVMKQFCRLKDKMMKASLISLKV
jgi:hypothetical protein